MKTNKNPDKPASLPEAERILAENQVLKNTIINQKRELEQKTLEIEIEASLEKVRVFALSMKRPADMLEVCRTISEQMQVHGIHDVRNVQTALIDNKNNTYINYQYFTAYGEVSIEETKYNKHPKVFEMVEKMQQSADAFFVVKFEGEELEKFRQYRKADHQFPDPLLDASTSLNYYFYAIGGGWLGLSTYKPLSDEGLDMFRRFHKAFGLAYRRFIDIEHAETLAREAIRHSSLDRVRGQIANMRTTEDLQHITPLIWHELEILGVPFIRCGLIIINESAFNVQIYLTSPVGNALGSMLLPLDYNNFIAKTYAHWRKMKVYTEHWTSQEFIAWMKSMLEFGQIRDPGIYQGAATPPESLYLHFVPFGQGILYVGNVAPLADEKLSLINSLAETFSVAYARYEDFSKLRKSKEEVEQALLELKSTQMQLIQSEKMASLGELAAGISHEIQNPLNFVNNFSEMSKELIVEIQEELAVGNWQLANEILKDVSDNLEKINHHGKRADSIIKGMLQHSRSSPGIKEPTDLNALVDEFLRLAYHGLRARDKSFNAILETDFDPNLGKVNVVPQDMGRVILNLITNAFYAVNEKRISGVENYQPLVTVSTRKTNDKVMVLVHDNGNGIPTPVLEKIFQPFFTTKPAGGGTGLGLSLSYDIVTKGHGGELKVKTKEGEGSEFIVLLNV